MHELLLKQDTTSKEQIDKQITKLEFEANKRKEYNIEVIWDNIVYANKAVGYLLGLSYLVIWKSYFKEENSSKPLLTIQHLKNLISYFFKKHLKKSTATSLFINFVLLIDRLTIKPIRPTTKQKQGQSAKSINKQGKNWV